MQNISISSFETGFKLRAASLFGNLAVKFVPVILPACEHLDDYDDVYQFLNPLKIYIELRYWINVR